MSVCFGRLVSVIPLSLLRRHHHHHRLLSLSVIPTKTNISISPHSLNIPQYANTSHIHPSPQSSTFLQSFSFNSQSYHNFPVQHHFLSCQNLSQHFLSLSNACFHFAHQKPHIFRHERERYDKFRAEDEFVSYEHVTEEFVRVSNAFLDFARQKPDLLRMVSFVQTLSLNPQRERYESFQRERRDMRFRVEDEFVSYEGVSEDFVRASYACLVFSRGKPDMLRLLSRRDIEVIVENGTPFVFKSSLDTTRRMRAFLSMDGDNNVSEFDKAHTVDLMKYLLSYASNPSISSDKGGLHRGELLESSVRNLLSELSTLCTGAQGSDPSVTCNFADNYGQYPRQLGPKIEMKRGDWICSKCSFMNFAKNMKCLECEEARPKKQLTGGEWECPQCDFFNYGRNQVCLRCDCKRPVEASFATNSSSNVLHGKAAYETNPATERRLADNEEKAQRWFSKISQMDSASELSSAAADEDFPEIMPLRKGENKFVVSTRKTPLQRRLANSSQYQGSSNNSLQSNDFRKRGSNTVGSNSNFVPFVPFPSDMFAKKPQSTDIGHSKHVVAESTDSSLKSSDQSTSASGDDTDKAIAEKPERWFKKMAELHAVKDLSTISNEDFPEIMPLRKGENRFVVSKKKDRSLTSPMNKRKMAMEQAGNTNSVPFVPFPPDYFAKKNKEPNVADPTLEDKNKPSSSPSIPNIKENKSGGTSINSSPAIENHQTDIENSNTAWKGKSLEGSAVVELDPLDMSEEAKAQRWFRRVAQIKDISELSQIPDEDFPSIMPMRKGVNRFVVSKRKTPLERRLTSPQYKRNLPIVSSDTPRKENENN